jgi:hypothetical protein
MPCGPPHGGGGDRYARSAAAWAAPRTTLQLLNWHHIDHKHPRYLSASRRSRNPGCVCKTYRKMSRVVQFRKAFTKSAKVIDRNGPGLRRNASCYLQGTRYQFVRSQHIHPWSVCSVAIVATGNGSPTGGARRLR